MVNKKPDPYGRRPIQGFSDWCVRQLEKAFTPKYMFIQALIVGFTLWMVFSS